MAAKSLRRFISALAAYLVVLHTVGMGAMAAPAAASPLLVICSVEADASHPSAPGHTEAEHAPCALCGLGACSADAPRVDAVPAIYAPAVALRPLATVHPMAQPHVVGSARPRGPPVV